MLWCNELADGRSNQSIHEIVFVFNKENIRVFEFKTNLTNKIYDFPLFVCKFFLNIRTTQLLLFFLTSRFGWRAIFLRSRNRFLHKRPLFKFKNKPSPESSTMQHFRLGCPCVWSVISMRLYGREGKEPRSIEPLGNYCGSIFTGMIQSSLQL